MTVTTDPRKTGVAASLARPLTVACLGDSITEYNSAAGSYYAKGYLVQARAFAGGRFIFNHSLNFGVSGQTSAQIYARVGDVIAARPYICCVMAGTNDPVVGGITKEQTWANLQATYEALIASGIKVVACTITARTSVAPASNGPAKQQYNYVNQRIRDYGLMVGPDVFCVADTANSISSMGSSGGDSASGATTDGIHPSDFGGELVGLDVFNALSGWLPPASYMPRNRVNTYSATDNPYGNRLGDKGWNVGTAGTASTGTSGSVTTGMTSLRLSGTTLTAVMSKGVFDAVNGGETQIITLGGGSGGAGLEELLYTVDAGSVWQDGERLVLEVDVDASALTNVNGLKLLLQANGTVTTATTGFVQTGITSDRTSASWSKTIQTPPLTISTANGISFLRCRMSILGDCTGAGVSGTITVKSMTLRLANQYE